jgi:spore coat polysaccharide biosynthesis predicted glycosyltransferase SpsG
MAEFMAWADLCVGAGGTTHWERCTLGLPSVIITTGMNQEAVARDLHRAGAIHYLGRADDVSAEQLAAAVAASLRDPRKLESMSKAARGIVTGKEPAAEFDWAGLLEREGHLGTLI